MERLTDGLKKILLAGIGTVAVTAEKSKEVLDEMVKRGELTVEQGKVLNQEADESVFEDEDIVTDTSADGKSASGGESQTADIKIEAEDDKEESVN